MWDRPLTDLHIEFMGLSKKVKKNESSQEIILAFLKSFWYVEIGFAATAITASIAKPEYIVAPILAMIGLLIIRQVAQSKLNEFDDRIMELREERDKITSHIRERESRAKGRFLRYLSTGLPSAPSGPRTMNLGSYSYPIGSITNPLEDLGSEVVEDMRYVSSDIVEGVKAIHDLHVTYETILNDLNESASKNIENFERENDWQYGISDMTKDDKVRGLYRVLTDQIKDYADFDRYAKEFSSGEGEIIELLLERDERNPFPSLRNQSDLLELSRRLEETRKAFYEKYEWLEYEIARRFGEI